jgi:cation transport ATPase
MVTIIVAVAWMQFLQPAWFGNIIVVIVVLAGGYPIFKESLVALRKGRVNVELSMVIGIIASLALSQFLAAIVITFFALLSALSLKREGKTYSYYTIWLPEKQLLKQTTPLNTRNPTRQISRQHKKSQLKM